MLHPHSVFLELLLGFEKPAALPQHEFLVHECVANGGQLLSVPAADHCVVAWGGSPSPQSPAWKRVAVLIALALVTEGRATSPSSNRLFSTPWLLTQEKLSFPPKRSQSQLAGHQCFVFRLHRL